MNKHSRFADVLIGAGYLALVVVVIIAAFLAYNRAFVSSVDVKLQAGSVGNALQDGSDVKLHGVPVGEVKNVKPENGGALLTLALDPDASKTIATNVTARLLPKTLFGERYVSLISPNAAAAQGLSSGDVIYQDTSNEAIELEDVFDELLPMLQSIQPAKLAAMLGEMSTMLRGKGTDIGDAMDVWDKYLGKLNPHVPQMTKDFERLADVASSYNEALPDLLSALDAMTTTSKTMVERESDLRSVYANVITSADTSRGWVAGNQQTIEVLSASSRRALEAVQPYAKQFPCLLQATRKFIPQMDKNLGKGTDEPGIHVRLNVVESRGKYLAGKDTVGYTSGGTPRCPYVTGQVGTKPASATKGSAGGSEPQAASRQYRSSADGGDDEQVNLMRMPAPPISAADAPGLGLNGLGPANSRGENQLIAELMAPTVGDSPSEYPEFASLLLGPVLRGTQVTLQ